VRVLREAGLVTVGDLCRCAATDLLGRRNFGRAMLHEVNDALAARRLALGLRF
jgi:DNA-directed RNA polymerase alpha subunit